MSSERVTSGTGRLVLACGHSDQGIESIHVAVVSCRRHVFGKVLLLGLQTPVNRVGGIYNLGGLSNVRWVATYSQGVSDLGRVINGSRWQWLDYAVTMNDGRLIVRNGDGRRCVWSFASARIGGGCAHCCSLWYLS